MCSIEFVKFDVRVAAVERNHGSGFDSAIVTMLLSPQSEQKMKTPDSLTFRLQRSKNFHKPALSRKYPDDIYRDN
jgi:hypothetical protein